MLTTQDVLAGTDTCYQGPCQDRIPLKEAHEKGTLRFVVNTDHIHTPVGQSSTLGSFSTVEEAVECARQHRDKPGLQISCVAGAFGQLDECRIWCSWWKPYGDLD